MPNWFYIRQVCYKRSLKNLLQQNSYLKGSLPLEIVKLLVGKLTKEEINAVDNKGNTLLHKALDYYHANEELAKILLSHTDINVKIEGEDNKTPLHWLSSWAI